MWAIDHVFPTRIVFEPDLYLDLEQRIRFWTLFCVSPTCIDAVVHVNPRWDKLREVLVVSPWLRGDPQFWFTIRDVIIYFMQWRDFSETRWGDVGHSGRLWIRSVYVGVEALVDFALASTEIHNKHLLGGYRGLDYECRKYLAIVCFGTFPAESFIVSMLEDDRFFKFGPLLWDDIQSETDYVLALPQVCF